jgi:hypothetical protein
MAQKQADRTTLRSHPFGIIHLFLQISSAIGQEAANVESVRPRLFQPQTLSDTINYRHTNPAFHAWPILISACWPERLGLSGCPFSHLCLPPIPSRFCILQWRNIVLMTWFSCRVHHADHVRMSHKWTIVDRSLQERNLCFSDCGAPNTSKLDGPRYCATALLPASALRGG